MKIGAYISTFMLAAAVAFGQSDKKLSELTQVQDAPTNGITMIVTNVGPHLTNRSINLHDLMGALLKSTHASTITNGLSSIELVNAVSNYLVDSKQQTNAILSDLATLSGTNELLFSNWLGALFDGVAPDAEDVLMFSNSVVTWVPRWLGGGSAELTENLINWSNQTVYKIGTSGQVTNAGTEGRFILTDGQADNWFGYGPSNYYAPYVSEAGWISSLADFRIGLDADNSQADREFTIGHDGTPTANYLLRLNESGNLWIYGTLTAIGGNLTNINLRGPTTNYGELVVLDSELTVGQVILPETNGVGRVIISAMTNMNGTSVVFRVFPAFAPSDGDVLTFVDNGNEDYWTNAPAPSGSAGTNHPIFYSSDVNLPSVRIWGNTNTTTNYWQVETNGVPIVAINSSAELEMLAGTAGSWTLYNDDGSFGTTVTIPGDQGGNLNQLLPPVSGHLATSNSFTITGEGAATITSGGNISGGINWTVNVATASSAASLTNVIVSTTNATHLDLGSFNMFRLWMLTNTHLVFTNHSSNFNNGLVYFQQDTNGTREVLTWTVAGGQLQTNASLGLTTNANALDLLEVKSGFFAENLIAYWPKDFTPRLAFTNSLTPHVTAGSASVSNSTYSAEEGAQVTFHVLRTGGSAGAVAVDLWTTNGTAVAGSDYDAIVATNLTWNDGVTDAHIVSISITDDIDTEGDETFGLFLSNATGGLTITTDHANQSVVTIPANDAACNLYQGGNTAALDTAAQFGYDATHRGVAFLLTNYWTNTFTICKATAFLAITNGSPVSQNIFCSIWTDNGADWPSNEIGTVSVPVNATTIPATETEIEFAPSATLTNGEVYWLAYYVTNDVQTIDASRSTGAGIVRFKTSTGWSNNSTSRRGKFRMYSSQ